MGNLVAVDPNRMQALAGRLHALHTALITAPGEIRPPYEDWGGSVDTTALTMALQTTIHEANAMDNRTVLAYAAMSPHYQGGSSPVPGTKVEINWDYDDEDLSAASVIVGRDFTALVNTTAESETPDEHRARIEAIATLIEQNQDESAFLEGFWPEAAAGAAALPDAVRFTDWDDYDSPDHGYRDPLSPEWSATIATFATGFAAATRAHANGQITLPPSTYEPFTTFNPEQAWSVGAFVARGPDGTQWDPDFLAQTGAALLEWRMEQSENWMPYAYDEEGRRIELREGTWYQDILLGVPNNPSELVQSYTRILAANDPVLALLSRIEESPEASLALLSDPDTGRTSARGLLQNDWDYPLTDVDEATYAAGIIDNATAVDLRGTDDVAAGSARSAMNVVEAAAAIGWAGKTDDPSYYYNERGLVSPAIQEAITRMAQDYVPDLAESSMSTSVTSENAYVSGDEATGVHTVHTGTSSVVGLMRLLDDNPDLWGDFRASVDDNIANAAAFTVDNVESGQDSPSLQGAFELNAHAQLTENAAEYDDAQQQDAWKARLGSAYGTASHYSGVIGGVFPNPYLLAANQINSAASPLITPFFDSDAAAQQAIENHQLFLQDMSDVSIQLAEGLLLADEVELPTGDDLGPPGQPFYADGKFQVTPGNRPHFDTWVNDNPELFTQLQDGRNAYDLVFSDISHDQDRYRP